MKRNIYLSMGLFIIAFFKMWGQDYKKDSLQIKAYTEILYKQNSVKAITLKKIFCSYCTEQQKEEIGNQAIRLAEIEKEVS